jgi:hypothetical protein
MTKGRTGAKKEDMSSNWRTSGNPILQTYTSTQNPNFEKKNSQFSGPKISKYQSN